MGVNEAGHEEEPLSEDWIDVRVKVFVRCCACPPRFVDYEVGKSTVCSMCLHPINEDQRRVRFRTLQDRIVCLECWDRIQAEKRAQGIK